MIKDTWTLFVVIFGLGDYPVNETDNQDGCYKVIDGRRLLMAESGYHGLSDHSHKSDTYENAYMESASFEMRYLGIQKLYHKP